jgi:hypothetical protein
MSRRYFTASAESEPKKQKCCLTETESFDIFILLLVNFFVDQHRLDADLDPDHTLHLKLIGIIHDPSPDQTWTSKVLSSEKKGGASFLYAHYQCARGTHLYQVFIQSIFCLITPPSGAALSAQ